MRAFPLPLPNKSLVAQSAPALIGLGLAILLAASAWPAVPVITGMALVALGATGATIGRVERAGALRGMLAVHLVVYASLYMLFVGAVWHAVIVGPRSGISLPHMADFAGSVAVMLLVVRQSLAAMTEGGDTSAR